MQVEAGESNLSLFKTFSIFYFFFSHERVLEELALLKIDSVANMCHGSFQEQKFSLSQIAKMISSLACTV